MIGGAPTGFLRIEPDIAYIDLATVRLRR